MTNVAIIGDVHGCFDTLMALIAKIPKEDKICFVGDLIDRGRKSRQVVEYVMSSGHDCVQGNHDYWMANYPIDAELWMDYRNGGRETMASYSNTLDVEHIGFMASLPLYKIYDDKLLVSHSTAARVWPFENPSPLIRSEIQWGRNAYPKKINGLYNVFGHTIQLKPLVMGHWACIDTGCCRGGPLTALRWPSMEVIQQENLEVRDD